jgi:hypothetical protein
MSHVTTAPAASALRMHTPVLVTAAGAPVRSSRALWLRTALIGGLGRIRTALTQPRPIYSARERAYFEAARMSRAMDRL